MTPPTTHRVHPQAADAWVCDNAKPPGDGFEEVEAPFSWRTLAVWVILIATGWSLIYVGVRWLWFLGKAYGIW